MTDVHLREEPMSTLLENWEVLVQLVLITLVVLAGPAVIFLLVARNGNL